MIWFLLGLVGGVALCAAFPPLPEWARSLALGLAKGHSGGNPVEKPVAVGRALANIARFIWRWKWAILVVLLFFLGFGWMRGCAPSLGDFGKSKGEIALERDIAINRADVEGVVHEATAEIMAEFNRRMGGLEAAAMASRQILESVPDDASDLEYLRSWASADRLLYDAGAGG